jgi:hypothetical protein
MRLNESTRAMEPPPAPISTMSITGMRTGKPLPLAKRAVRATSKCRDCCGVKSSISVSFAVVPPISNEIARS